MTEAYADRPVVAVVVFPILASLYSAGVQSVLLMLDTENSITLTKSYRRKTSRTSLPIKAERPREPRDPLSHSN